MGVVERVYDADLMRELAVKRLAEELRAEDRMQRQFLSEARVGRTSTIRTSSRFTTSA